MEPPPQGPQVPTSCVSSHGSPASRPHPAPCWHGASGLCTCCSLCWSALPLGDSTLVPIPQMFAVARPLPRGSLPLDLGALFGSLTTDFCGPSC